MIDDALTAALGLAVDGNLAPPIPDAHLAGRNRHGDALADEAPRHRVAVGVDSTAQSLPTTRVSSRRLPNDGRCAIAGRSFESWEDFEAQFFFT